MMPWKEAADAIRRCDDFALIAHIAPDGDTVGSVLALLFALESMGKRVTALCDGDPPSDLRKLPGLDRFERYDDTERAHFCASNRTVIAVDCADRGRLGAAIELFDETPVRIVIDHHVSNDGFGGINLIDGGAAATGELIAQLIDELGVAMTTSIAACLYAAIASDTGGFVYSNTTGITLRLAARLIDFGIDFSALQRDLFRTRSIAKTRLIALCLQDFSLHYDGQMSLRVITGDELRASDLLTTDSNGVVEFLRDIEGVEVAVYARQLASGLFKVSMRSQQSVDVASLAARYAGGGHIRAAGFSWHGSDPEVLKSELIALIGDALGCGDATAGGGGNDR